VEHFNGLDLGYSGGAWKGNKLAFDKIFNPQLGGKINGVALGIGGDRIQNLLYRLRNGEAPAEFHPRVWWIVIGTNDLEDKCNADTIVVGHFRLVEQIRKYHPGATIVLNSVLPRNENPDDLFMSPSWQIIQEINLKLECYSNTARGVEFFNATDAFIAHRKGKVVVNQQFMKDSVHPNAEGTRLWGDAIADRVIELKQRRNHYRDKKNNNH
jgi:lysophospholipase L1-like esterase